MKLSAVIESYIGFKQGLGMRLDSQATMLRAFGRALKDIEMARVKPSAVQAFFDSKRPVTANLRNYFSVINNFYRYAVSRGFATAIPLPTTLPKIPPPAVPYIYTVENLRSLLIATDVLKTRRCPWRGREFRTFLLLLYGTGLRFGEAVSLTLHDVDLTTAVITVRNGKNFKSRLVPIGPKLTQELVEYDKGRRDRQPRSLGNDSAFFVNSRGARWKSRATHTYFRIVCRRAGIIRKGDSHCQQPRLHDLRHTAAQHRLEAWYQEGKDVQRMLPQLATFLGHRDIAQLQYYLHMTPELLRAASQRFEGYAQP